MLQVQVKFTPGNVYQRFQQVTRGDLHAAPQVNYPHVSVPQYYNVLKYIKGL